MPDWATYLILILTSIGSAIGAVTTITKPMKKQMDGIVAKELEKEKGEQRMQSLEGWTENQQSDLDNLNEGVVIIASAVEALLFHTIDKQGGNGRCTDAQKEVKEFLREKALSKKSHK